ncbi:MAG TPA: Ig-like domain repeat protein [Candidatus Eisenbacteria bacterium]|nr:Ig-like domain repeat protein [Candidatus Eisenbacteria bacterium]
MIAIASLPAHAAAPHRAARALSARPAAKPASVQLGFPTGGAPYSVAVGDLDRDGRLDVVTANEIGNSISVLLGDGHGALGPNTDFAAGTSPYAVALADVNGDSLLDAVVANSGSNTVSVLLGNGRGGFGPKHDFATGINPRSVAVADLNGDSKPDIVVGNLTSNTISVLLGDGTGGFAAKNDFGSGRNPYSVAIGDVTGDGAPDVVTADYGGGTVSVLAGNGAGAFVGLSQISVGTAPYCVALADLDRDGKLDVAVSIAASNMVSVFHGLGGGAFGTEVDIATGSSPRLLTVGDMNGDSIPDLTVTDIDAGTVGLLIGNSLGGYSRQDFAVGAAPRGIAFGHLSADSVAALLVSNVADNTVSVVIPGSGLALTRTDLTTRPNPSPLNQFVTMVAHVERISGGLPLPSGTVVFRDNGVGIGGAVVTGDSAVVSKAFTVGGKHSLVASYGGDAHWLGSVSDVVIQQVMTGSQTVLTTNVNPSVPGQTVVLTAAVSPSPGVGTPTGSVTFQQDTVVIGTVPLVAGVAQISLSSLALGSYLFVGRYSGDSTFVPSASAPLLQRVFAATQTAVSSDHDPAPYGTPVQITATIAVVPPGTGPADGTVNFRDGATPIRSMTSSGGVASFSTSTLTPGAHSIVATFVGAPGFVGSSSAPFTQTIAAGATISAIADVPADQGREVRLAVAPSPLDVASSIQPIVRYDVFRRIDAAPARASHAALGWLAGRSAPPPAAVKVAGWDAVGSMGAYTDNVYNIVVPTLVDSNTTGPHPSTFFVRAATATPNVYYDSAPDSGYSVDNIPPSTPVAFAAERVGGATRLTWRRNPETDVVDYRLYRGAEAGFAPGPGNLLATLSDTSYVDAGAGWYELAAYDLDGNASPFAGAASDTAAVRPLAFALAGVRPNPARVAPFEVRFTLPDATPATLELLDVAGRLVARREVGSLGAGEHVVRMPERAIMRPGRYLLRLTQGGRAQVRSILLAP